MKIISTYIVTIPRDAETKEKIYRKVHKCVKVENNGYPKNVNIIYTYVAESNSGILHAITEKEFKELIDYTNLV